MNQSFEDPKLGRKFDSGKTRYGLLPSKALKEVADVLTVGAKKYAPENWRYVENGKERYFDAALRHIWQWKDESKTDAETGKHHLAHAICCLMFITDLELQESVALEQQSILTPPTKPDIIDTVTIKL